MRSGSAAQMPERSGRQMEQAKEQAKESQKPLAGHAVMKITKLGNALKAGSSGTTRNGCMKWFPTSMTLIVKTRIRTRKRNRSKRRRQMTVRI